MTPAREPIGLIAGAGRFPFAVVEKARQAGTPVVCVGLVGMADPALAALCSEYRPLGRISLGFIIRTFRRGGVRRWTMAGKVYKHHYFRPWRIFRLLPDWRALRLWYLRNRSDHRDDSLLLALIREFEDAGLQCVSALDLCPELLVRPGVLTKRPPTEVELADIEYGWVLAKETGRFDVGQSVMVREKTVLAVEAIEGTDEAIRRAGTLCRRGGFVVVKVAKPQQDNRFDVPTVGIDTIETMRAAGARVLAIEANRTILLDEAETIARADRYNMTVVARDG
jgi:DUF1009 family protein